MIKRVEKYLPIIIILSIVLWSCRKWNMEKSNPSHIPFYKIDTLIDQDTNAQIRVKIEDFGAYESLDEFGILYSVIDSHKMDSSNKVKITNVSEVGSYTLNLSINPEYSPYYYSIYGIQDTLEFTSKVYLHYPSVHNKIVILDSIEINNIESRSCSIVAGVFQNRNRIIEKGIVWSTGGDPNYKDSKFIEEGAIVLNNSGSQYEWKSKIQGLERNTKYYVRAYAQDDYRIAYSVLDSFMTGNGMPIFLSVSSEFEDKNVIVKASYELNDDSIRVINEGFEICQNLNKFEEALKYEDSFFEDEEIEINVGVLSSLQQYYARAFIHTEFGTIYSDTIIFTSKESVPILGTTTSSNVTSTTAYITGSVITDYSIPSITERGFVYGTSTNPTINDNKEIKSGDFGSMTYSMTELTPSTTYYVRAYATNSQGTTYSNEINFTTGDGLPTFGTTTSSNVTSTTAYITGSVTTADDIPEITERGFVYGTSANPTINDNKEIKSGDFGSMTYSMTGLTPSTSYYVKAYAINSQGTTYSNEINFTTGDGLPTFGTTTSSNVTSTTAYITGSVTTADDIPEITERGFVYGTSINPTINDNKEIKSGDFGSMTFNMSGLALSTTYYVRAFATNSQGTTYSNEINFTTEDGLPTFGTTTSSNVTSNTATITASVTEADDIPEIAERGFVYSLSANPTINDSKEIKNGTFGNMTFSMTGLALSTTYYVRAYATNSLGTTYSNEVNFTTNNGLPIVGSVSTDNISSISVELSANIQGNGIVPSLSERGFVYNNIGSPTIADVKIILQGTNFGIIDTFLMNLSSSTTYHVRAYAINIHGIAYSDEIIFNTKSSNSDVVDIDGNIYEITTIGNQIWMAEDLRVTRFKDGSEVLFDNNTIEGNNCGYLYNSEIVLDSRGICPTGWHVPSGYDWSTLIDYIGGDAQKLKSPSNWDEGGNGSNNYGFNSKPCISGSQGGIAIYWSSEDGVGYFGDYLIGYYLVHYNNEIQGAAYTSEHFYSIRCIKD